MASAKLMMKMSSSTSRNSDLIRRKSANSSSSSSSTNHLLNHKNVGIRNDNKSGVFQMTVDDLLPSVHNNTEQQAPETTLLDAEISLLDAADTLTAFKDSDTAGTASRHEIVRTSSNGSQKTVDDVWKEIVAGRSCKQEVPDEMMTLEDFLAKAGAVEEEDVKMPPPLLQSERLSGGIFSFENPIPANVDGVVGFGIGVDEMGGRGKRRAILEPLDRAAQQRQRRMIKNRESAARSRERKQAYQAELEALAVKLEEENETLVRAKAEQTRKRYKQLMDNIIPVTETQSRRTKHVLRKVRSFEW